METSVLIVILGSLFPTIIGIVIKRGMSSMEKKMDRKEQDEEAYTRLIIKFLKILAENDAEVFEALESGRTNGNLKRAHERLKDIENEMSDYLINKASRRD